MELYVKTRAEWRLWLEENHSAVQGIWLIYYKKSSGKPRIAYNDAVEEALCYGWIDGKIKRVNDDYYMQWFTPRRPRSRWSKLNIARVQKLINEGLMQEVGLQSYKKAVNDPIPAYDTKSDANLVVPDDLISALSAASMAYNNFISFPPSSRKLYVFWLNDAKRAETRKRRIERIVELSARNIRAGMM